MNSATEKIIQSLLRPFRGLGLRQFSIVRRILGALKQNSVVVRGKHRMFLDPTDFVVSNEISGGDYEAMETSVVEKSVRPTDTVIDLGANIGYFTVLFCELAHKGHVYAFEPAPQTFNFLRKRSMTC